MKSRLRIVGAVVVVALLLAGVVALFARGHDVFGLSFAGSGGASTDWFGPATFDGKPYLCPSQPAPAGGSIGAPAIIPRIAHPAHRASRASRIPRIAHPAHRASQR